jgi:hypothetical protein
MDGRRDWDSDRDDKQGGGQGGGQGGQQGGERINKTEVGENRETDQPRPLPKDGDDW